MINEFLNITKEVDSYLSKKDNLEVLNKLLLIECKHNLNLISCLKSDLDQQGDEILSVIDLLETDILRLFLSDKIKSKSTLDKVKDRFLDKVDDESDDLVSNLLLKVKILKSIRQLPFKEKSGYKKFRLRTRLDFLKKKLNQLRLILEKKTDI